MPQPERLVWRSELGWSSRSPAAYANPTRGLVIHYDSSDQNLANKDHPACVDYWNWCRDFHTGGNGWVDVGYSFMACVHGYVMEGRGLFRVQAAQRGANSTHYSVTLACGPTDTITGAQIDAVRELRAWLMEPDTSISGSTFGHRDFNSTSCPGDAAYAMVRSGVFERPPGSSIPDDIPGTGANGGDDVIGLRKGDKGEEVEALQVLIHYAGRGDALEPYGVDGGYGDKTAEGLRLVREDVGSEAGPGWGDKVTPWAYGQLMTGVARHQD